MTPPASLEEENIIEEENKRGDGHQLFVEMQGMDGTLLPLHNKE